MMLQWPDIDFSLLKELNPDTLGWIYLEDTPISYPVVRGRGDGYYLRHNFTFEESPHGCIYAEPGDVFPGRRSLLTGHNMKDASMFTHLLRYYYDEGFADTHPVIMLKTPENDYAVRVWLCVQFPDGYEFAAYPPEQQDAFAQWEAAMRRLCPFAAAFDLHADDAVMVFRTCRPFQNNEPDGTLIVIGKVCEAGKLRQEENTDEKP